MWSWQTIVDHDLFDYVFDEDNKEVEGLMQYTGLTDCKGTDIYEGDVLFQHSHWNECAINKRIIKAPLNEPYRPEKQEGCNDQGDSYTEVIYEYGGFSPLAWAGEEGNPDVDEYEVIGDIYSNPELKEKIK
jgi:hypothetical protein